MSEGIESTSTIFVLKGRHSKLLIREICWSYLTNSRGRRVFIPPIESLLHFTAWFIIISSYFVSSNISNLFLNYGTMVNLWPGLEYFCTNPRNIQSVIFSRQWFSRFSFSYDVISGSVSSIQTFMRNSLLSSTGRKRGGGSNRFSQNVAL